MYSAECGVTDRGTFDTQDELTVLNLLLFIHPSPYPVLCEGTGLVQLLLWLCLAVFAQSRLRGLALPGFSMQFDRCIVPPEQINELLGD